MALPVAALISAGQGAYQYFQGEKQKKLAKDLKPSNYIPAGVKEATLNARADANATMGPTTKRGLEKISQSTATAVENAKRSGGSPGQVQQAVADIDARQKETLKDLQVHDSAFKVDRRQDLNRSLQAEGQYERMSRDAYNAAKSALTGASMQNKFNAVSGVAEGAVHSYYDAVEAKEFGGSTGAAARRASGTNPMRSVTAKDGGELTGPLMGRMRRMYGRYPGTQGMGNFDYRKYLEDMNIQRLEEKRRFQTGF